ncbi:uncharacterized protein RCO7_03607 [Rhynchosporium graminicola]|uniref:Uncharacterized protein n=1 Tax=Rhynchosporium graminicola TaxID=2792576 RepID=A0A1E1LQS0_9HELO|nr:uncharacterized protein RCO7_03607 [Rhynchosporium commune]
MLPRVYPDNVSFISDNMIQIATASIAQVGYRDDLGFAVQIYPRASFWVILANGSTVEVGNMISVFAIGVIVDATINNPYTDNVGTAPMRGIYLSAVVAVLTNRVMVRPDGHLSMSLLLSPTADALNGVGGGKENKAFRDAKRNKTVLYEKYRDKKILDGYERSLM